MRNWNFCWVCRVCWFRASRLPMRNWNQQYCQSRAYYLSSFQTTYEELKLPPMMVIFIDLPLPDYLWGIETTTTNTQIRTAILSLPDYLWGIETPNTNHQEDKTERFQTTYEELKHRWSDPLQASLAGFQTTYEELKRLFFLWWFFRWRRFQTTYEELKLPSPLPLTLSLPLASRLPMRNWNQTGENH